MDQRESREVLGGGWQEVSAAAGVRSRVYALQRGSLYAVSPETGERVELSADCPTGSLVGLGDELFLFADSGALYRAPAMTGEFQREDGIWGKTSAVAAAGDRLFAIDGGALHSISPHGGWDRLSAGWRTRAMVGLDRHVYLFEEDGTLWRAGAAGGDAEELAAGLGDTTAAAAAGGRLFAIASGRLHAIDPTSGDRADLGGGWSAHHLVGLGPHLFAFEEGGTLSRIRA